MQDYIATAIIAICFISGLVAGGAILAAIFSVRPRIRPDRKSMRKRRKIKRKKQKSDTKKENTTVDIKSRLASSRGSRTSIDCDGEGIDEGDYIRSIRGRQNDSYQYTKNAGEKHVRC